VTHIHIDYDSMIAKICEDYGIIRPQHDNLQQQLREVLQETNLSDTQYFAYESMFCTLRSSINGRH
jgi:hypothetical protein